MSRWCPRSLTLRRVKRAHGAPLSGSPSSSPSSDAASPTVTKRSSAASCVSVAKAAAPRPRRSRAASLGTAAPRITVTSQFGGCGSQRSTHPGRTSTRLSAQHETTLRIVAAGDQDLEQIVFYDRSLALQRQQLRHDPISSANPGRNCLRTERLRHRAVDHEPQVDMVVREAHEVGGGEL